MLVTSDSFVAKTHPVLLDPEVSDERKRQFREMGWAESLNQMELCDIVDDCFLCGQKLTTPYVYWHGWLKGLSLHPRCAMELGFGLVQDVYAASHEGRADCETTVADWVKHFVGRKEYGLQDEVLPPQ